MKTIMILSLVLALICGCTTTRHFTSSSSDSEADSDVLAGVCTGIQRDQLYKLIGLLDEFQTSKAIASTDSWPAGTFLFWQSEYPVAKQVAAILQSLKRDGIISGEVTISVSDVGQSAVLSTGVAELLRPFVVKSPEGWWMLSDELFDHATDEQKLLYLASVHKRWGGSGKNMIWTPKVSYDRLVRLLGPHTTDIKSIIYESFPGGRVLVFNPDDDLAKRLGITQRVNITLAPEKQKSSDLVTSEWVPGSVDKKYAFSLHVAELGNLDAKELEVRLKYFSWIKGTFSWQLKLLREGDYAHAQEEIAEILELIKRIDEVLAQQQTEGYSE